MYIHTTNTKTHTFTSHAFTHTYAHTYTYIHIHTHIHIHIYTYTHTHIQLHWLACNGRTELLVSILQKGEFVDVVVSKLFLFCCLLSCLFL